MKIIFTNRLDLPTLTLPEDAITIEVHDTPGKFSRGGFISLFDESGFVDQPGGNDVDSEIITLAPADCVVFSGTNKIMSGIITGKFFVFTSTEYICYCVVESHKKRKVLLQSFLTQQEISPTLHPLLSSVTRAQSRNPVREDLPITLPGVPVYSDGHYTVQLDEINDQPVQEN